MLRQLGQLQGDRRRERKGSFRADEEVGEVRHRFDEAVEVVAADAPLHLREPRLDLGALAIGKAEHPRGERLDALRTRDAADIVDPSEGECLTIRQHGVHAKHVVDHLAVEDRPRSAGVVACHAADSAAACGRWLDGEEKAVGAELRIQALEHHTGLDSDGALLGVIALDGVEVPAEVEDEPGADRLSVLGRPSPPRDQGYALFGRDLQRCLDVGAVFRKNDAGGHDLVDRGVGRIAPPCERVEAGFPL